MKGTIIKNFLLWLGVGLFCVSSCANIEPQGIEEETAFPPGVSVMEVQGDRTRDIQHRKCRYGYVDRNGKWAFPPQAFLNARSFSSGVARVSERQEDRISNIGYINSRGEYMIPPSLTDDRFYRSIYEFSEGLLPLRAEPNGKIGFINTRGEFLVLPQFDSVESFQEGLAAVSWTNVDGQQQHGYINLWGEIVIYMGDLQAQSFYEGVAIVIGESGFGLIDRQGNFLIDPILTYPYSSLEPLSPDVISAPEKPGFRDERFPIAVATPMEGNPYSVLPQWVGKWGYVSRYGGWAIEPQFSLAGPFSEERAVVANQKEDDPEWWERGMLIDMQGNIIETKDLLPKPQLKWWRTRFRKGLALAKSENRQWGYLGLDGRWTLLPQREFYGEFSGGLAPAIKDSKWGYIDRTGKFAIAPQFHRAEEFNEYGIAIVENEVECNNRNCKGLIDREGQYILSPEYDYIDRFVEGVAPIRKGGLYGYVDGRGKIIAEPKFDRVEDFSEGLGLVYWCWTVEPESSSN